MKKYFVFLFFLLICHAYSMEVTFIGAYPQKIVGRSGIVKTMYSEICKKGISDVSAILALHENIGVANDCFSAALEKSFFCKQIPIDESSSLLLINTASVGAKYGFYNSLVRLSKIASMKKDKIAKACCHAMLLLINPTHNRYALVVECLGREASKIRTIFGESVPIDVFCIEDDSYRFRDSPVVFKFSPANLEKIKGILETAQESHLKNVLLGILNTWNTSSFLDSIPPSLKE
jgi:hypothetical protein